ncbi:Protein transport protein Sec16B [Tupaia chinensis]|uniref:Protein transport protein Sec16B n=1 Tax=Tupaia chinensis TaxID=246437 RepID=L8Y6X7_TUPCH|nr:Protein transport protein Sec16B [Tupaia chinensis]
MAAAAAWRPCLPRAWLCRRAGQGCGRHYRAALCAELKKPLAIEDVASRPVRPQEGDRVIGVNAFNGMAEECITDQKVIAVAGSDEKCKLAVQRGAQSSVNYSRGSLTEAVKKLAGGGGVNVAIDMVGGDVFLETLRRPLTWIPDKDSPASTSGQERPGELFSESLRTGAQKNKPSLSSESNLLQQHESGLSSSSYELSQYMADTPELYDPTVSVVWSPGQAEDVSAAGPKEPKKFYIPHVPVSFGPGGQLVCAGPSSPTDGQTALVELHSMEVILNDSKEQEEMRSFSGPLTREDVHKVDIMTFCQQKATQSRRSETPGSVDSALLWQLLVLLCRQNGSMVGSDIAELLMQDCKKLDKYKRQPPVANLIHLTDEDWPVLSSGTPNLLTGEIPPSVESPEQIVEKFTRLLYYGRKKASGLSSCLLLKSNHNPLPLLQLWQ